MIDHEAWFPLVAFAAGAITGLGDLLRGHRKMTTRAVAAAVLWHGVASMGVALALCEHVQSRLLLYGIAIGSASGAFSAGDFLLSAVRDKLRGPAQGPHP